MVSVEEHDVNSKGEKSKIDSGDTETQAADTQSPSPSPSSSSPGKELTNGNPSEFYPLQRTAPVNGADTSLFNNLLSETEKVNFDGDTQALDDLDLVENESTQLLDEEKEEVLIGSESEGTDRTELLTDVDEVSDDGSERGYDIDPVGLEKRLFSLPHEQWRKDVGVDSDASIGERHSSGKLMRTS